MADCKDCKIVPKWSGNGERIVGNAIQHCEACTKAHETAAERDALRAEKQTLIKYFKQIRVNHGNCNCSSCDFARAAIAAAEAAERLIAKVPA